MTHLAICGQCGVSAPCACDYGTDHLYDGCPADEWVDDPPLFGTQIREEDL